MLIKIKIKMMIKIDRLGNLFVNKLKLNNSKYAKSINNLISYVTLTNYGYFHVQGHKFFPMHFDYCVNKLCEISLKDLNDFDGDVQLFIVQAAPVFLQYNYCGLPHTAKIEHMSVYIDIELG